MCHTIPNILCNIFDLFPFHCFVDTFKTLVPTNPVVIISPCHLESSCQCEREPASGLPGVADEGEAVEWMFVGGTASQLGGVLHHYHRKHPRVHQVLQEQELEQEQEQEQEQLPVLHN